MRSVGVYDRRAFREYFRRSAHHLAGALHIFREAPAPHTAERGMAPPLSALAVRRIILDESIQIVQNAARSGRGVVLVAPHIADYLFALARLNMVSPVTIYLRHSTDPRRQEAKRRWCDAVGLDFIAEPASATDPTSRAIRMHDALAEGRLMVITPDLPQKRDEGTAVRFFDREIYLPSGPAALSLLGDAPLIAITGRSDGAAVRLQFHGPYRAADAPAGRGSRRAAIAERMQWFATLFERFLVETPGLWFLWGDRRWARVFEGDERYVRMLAADGCAPSATPAQPAAEAT